MVNIPLCILNPFQCCSRVTYTPQEKRHETIRCLGMITVAATALTATGIYYSVIGSGEELNPPTKGLLAFTVIIGTIALATLAAMIHTIIHKPVYQAVERPSSILVA